MDLGVAPAGKELWSSSSKMPSESFRGDMKCLAEEGRQGETRQRIHSNVRQPGQARERRSHVQHLKGNYGGEDYSNEALPKGKV